MVRYPSRLIPKSRQDVFGHPQSYHQRPILGCQRHRMADTLVVREDERSLDAEVLCHGSKIPGRCCCSVVVRSRQQADACSTVVGTNDGIVLCSQDRGHELPCKLQCESVRSKAVRDHRMDPRELGIDAHYIEDSRARGRLGDRYHSSERQSSHRVSGCDRLAMP